MGPGRGGLAQNHLHMVYVRSHLLRHGEGAWVGIGARVRQYTRQLVAQGHDRILQHDGDDLQQPVCGEFHIPGDGRLHLLAVDVQPEIVVHLREHLFKGILPQRGVDGGPHRQNEVAQGFRGKPAPQVDRYGQRHRPLPPGALPVLLVGDHLQQDGSQVLRDGHPVAPGLLLQPGHRAEAHGDVEGIEGLCRTVVLVGLFPPLLPPGTHGGVAAVGVLPFRPPGLLRHVQNAVGVWDGIPQLPQVDRQQSLEKYQRPAAVTDGVEHLHGDALLIIVKAYQPAVVLPEAHRLAGVGDILLHKGPGGAVWLEVVPESPLLDAHPEGREPWHGFVHGPLQGIPVHPLRHHGREAVDGRIFLLLEGGIEHTRIVQGIPLRLFAPLVPRHTPPPFRST